MSNSVSPCSIWSTGSDSLRKTSFPFIDDVELPSKGDFSPISKNCKYCKEDLRNISSNLSERDFTSKSANTSTNGCQSKLQTISENIFGLYCPESADHSIQLENIFSAISQVKKDRMKSKLKIFCLTEFCTAVSQLCEESTTVAVDLSKPPQLMILVKFCENVFDWLAKDDENIAFFYCNTDESLLVTLSYAYSCYYDSLFRRDIRKSLEMKSFLTMNSKSLEKVPVAYRRYAGYMSLYSCMNELQSYRSSVNLYCLLLYNFPAMESSKKRTSQLFFKIYTNDPLKCSHTTKLYCLPSNVNRLVIMFDQYPILLRNDTMIICYHRSFIGSKRTKLLRINFHTCQVTCDMLTFYSQDFEDLYAGCPFKMKLDLCFQAAAVFGQGEPNFMCDTSLSNLSQLERFDSYQTLAGNKVGRTHSSASSTCNQSVASSITILKTQVTDHNTPVNDDEEKEKATEVINNNGRITGPIDSYHSTKLESVRTSSTVLNGLNSNSCDSKNRYGSSRNDQNYRIDKYDERDKCSKQLDTLMCDLNVNSKNSVPVTTTSISYTAIPQPHGTNNRELQLMTELLEAQKEISNLRRSMNHLDREERSKECSQISTSTVFNSRPGIVNDREVGTALDASLYGTSTSQTWKTPQKGNGFLTAESKETQQNMNRYAGKQDFHSLDGKVNHGGYSAHRDNMEKGRQLKEKCMTTEKIFTPKHRNHSESTELLEEIETINLQPIGKGIQDLNKGHASQKLPRQEHRSHGFMDNVESLSPLAMRHLLSKTDSGSFSPLHRGIFSPNPSSSLAFFNESPQHITLQLVEDKAQWWYQPSLSRDEAIVILRNYKPGSFLIRDSNTYEGSYGLAVKVASIPPNIIPKSEDLEAEKVRHYLIEPVGNQGVCFKGFPEEPVFPSLTNLVLYYTHTSSVLSCLLVLPDQALHGMSKTSMNFTIENRVLSSSPKYNQMQSSDIKNGFSVYYLGCFDVEYITGPSVVNKAIERLLNDLDARKFTECQLRINPNDGIVLTDVERKLFFRRHHLFSSISYCGLDPRDRKIELEMCKSKGIRKAKIFGIIVKNYIPGENKCFLFGEFDTNQKAVAIVKAICENLPKFV